MGFPRSKLAPTGRAACVQCKEKIAAGAVKIEIERPVETPQGQRIVPVSMHPACVAGFVERDAYPGGLAAFALAVSENGEVPVPELATQLPADAKLPLGDMKKLERLVSLDGKGSDFSSPDPITKAGQVTKPKNGPAKILELINAHRWDFEPHFDLDSVANHPPEILDALLAKAHTAAHRNKLRLDVMGSISRMLDVCPTWKTGIARIEALANDLEPGLDALDLPRGLGLCLEYDLKDAARKIAAATPSAVRHEAVWQDAKGLLGRDDAGVLAGWRFDALVDGVEDGEYEGRGLVHVAALVGSLPLLERFARDVNRPVGKSKEPIWIWSLGPNNDGDRTMTKLEIPAGERALDIVDRILALLREGRASLDQPFKPSASLKRKLAHYGDNGEVARFIAEREAQKPVVDARIARFTGVRDKLIALGATASAVRAPAVPTKEASKGSAKEVELPWLLEHLRDCGDDVFSDALDFQRAFSRAGQVIVEYRAAEGGDPMTTAIAWAKPTRTNERKLQQLIDAIADFE